MEARTYLTLKQLVQRYPAFTEKAVRHLILVNSNGIKKTIVKVGGKLLFDGEMFASWIESQRLEKD